LGKPTPYKMGKAKILVVEDEIIIADDIATNLNELGYETTEIAISYTEAIEIIEKEKPNLVIADIKLSGRKTGIDLGKEIKAKYKMPFIFLTSNSDKLTMEEALQVEPNAFLVKPFSKQELYASIELALNKFSEKKNDDSEIEIPVLKEALFIKEKKEWIRVNFNDIVYMKSDNVYVDIFLKNKKKHTVRGTLHNFEDKIDINFQRVHRSYIVNLNFLESFSSISVQVNGNELPIGKKYREELLTQIQKV
jgi:DNA-binding LytR/AlgR family response regulator